MTAQPIPSPVRVSRLGIRHDLRGVKIVLHRELLRFWYDKTRMIALLFQPLLFLLILGNGLDSLMPGSAGEANLKTFLFPGMIGMSVILAALFSAGSIVWDREFGFLREMMVAPIRRSAIVVGKVLGGTVIATLEGVAIIALAGLAGVPYNPLMILQLLLLMLAAAFSVTCFGVVLAARIKQMQAFMAIMQMAVLPMMFLSGALFPLSGLPVWLSVLTKINPFTYAIDPLRQAVFAHLTIPAELAARFNPGISWFGWHVPVGVEVLFVLAAGMVLLGIGIAEFRRGG